MPRSATLATVAVSLLAVILLGWFFFPMPATKQIIQVQIGGATVAVEVADTEATRGLGLSFRNSLLPGHGMLFIFDTPGNYGFWMKDMSFNLDIIFADERGNIITIDRGLSPSSYLKNPPEVFYPTSNAKYVLEVPAEFAAQNAITVGQVMYIQ
ncbi:MAG: DUF192 domain-containing protein [bacterium]|nr:DUF192 domain-containing protein [bacterium]